MNNVIAITGSEDLLRRRALLSAIQEQEQNGWRTMEVNGETPGSLIGALSQAGMLFEQQVLAVVHHPDKADLPTIESHLKVGDGSVVLLLYLERDPKGNTKFGKFIQALGKGHRNFEKPDKLWKQEGIAEAFCIGEANRLGVTLPQALAKAVVSSVGTDLGILSFEVLKMATAAKAEGTTGITPQQARGVLAGLSEGGIPQIFDALAARDPLKLGKAFSKVERTYKEQDRVFTVTGAVAFKAYSWFPIVKARESGLSVKEAAEQSGFNPWFYENKLYPHTVKWSTQDLIRLVETLAASERALLNGALDPWLFLRAKLMGVCAGVAQRGHEILVSQTRPVAPHSLVQAFLEGVPYILPRPYVLRSKTNWASSTLYESQENQTGSPDARSSRTEGDPGSGVRQGKYGEWGVSHYVYDEFGVLVLPDEVARKKGEKNWDPDMHFERYIPGFPPVGVKTCVNARHLGGGGFSIQKSDKMISKVDSGDSPDGWSKRKVQSEIGGVSYQYWDATTSRVDEYLALVVFLPAGAEDDGVPSVEVWGFVPLIWLLEHKLIQPHCKYDEKVGIYWWNILSALGLDRRFFRPETRGISITLADGFQL